VTAHDAPPSGLGALASLERGGPSH
jgi:hypothetical protein